MTTSVSTEVLAWLASIVIVGIIVKFTYEYIKDLRKPTNEEVKDLALLEGRLANIEFRQAQMESQVNGHVTVTSCKILTTNMEKILSETRNDMRELRKEFSNLRIAIIDATDSRS